LVGNEAFWVEQAPSGESWNANRDWIPPAIAEFLNVGTRNDDRAFGSELLPRSRGLIRILLDRSPKLKEIGGDAMTQAINSAKGKAIEVLFSQALRICRAGDRENGSHQEEWGSMQPLFEAELLKCRDDNFEFSTITGAYLAQLDYMSNEWARANINRIFSREFTTNCVAAVEGLAYASFTVPVYTLLIEGAVFDYALRYDFKEGSARKKLIERIAGAYLWGKEELDSSRFSYLFESGTEDDLEAIARLFWSVRGQQLDQMQQERIIKYWERCVLWAQEFDVKPPKVFSILSRLSCFLKTAVGRDLALLESVAPYVASGYDAGYFFEQLIRLVDSNPEGISMVLGKSIAVRIPEYDYENHLTALLLKLSQNGKKHEARLYANKLRALSGMQELFNQFSE
jgi:hypothetical protein